MLSEKYPIFAGLCWKFPATNSVTTMKIGTKYTAPCGTVTVGAGPAPIGPCTVRADGAGVRLQWDDFDKLRYSIRQNGSWVVSYTDGRRATTLPGSVDDVWTLLYSNDGVRISVPCVSEAGPPAGPCTVAARAEGVRVSWDPIDGVGLYHVRRNGRWLADVADETHHDHVWGALGDTYEVRYRRAGATIDVPCA